MRRLWLPGILALGLAAYAATGGTIVAPGEVVVVRRFGRILPHPWTAGPHFGAPWGIDRQTRLRLDEVRRRPIGGADADAATLDDDPGAAEFLTADRNFIRARGVVQYRIDDPIAFVAHAADAETLLDRLAESSLARALSRHAIDDALRAGGTAPALEAEATLREAVRKHQLGLAILGVRLADARPPAEVQPDFDAAQAARSAADRRLNEANTAAAVVRTAAEAQAQTRREQAEARAARVEVLAKAHADRFTDLLAESRRSRALTVRRLYRDALRDLLPKVRRKLLVTPEEPVDLSLFGLDGP